MEHKPALIMSRILGTHVIVGIWLMLGACPTRGTRHVDVSKYLAKARDRYSRRSLDVSAPVSLNSSLGLRNGEALMEVDRVDTVRGMYRVKYQETYLGVEVDGENVILEVDSDGEITGEGIGKLVEGLEESLSTTEVLITEWQALAIAVRSEGDDPRQVQFRPLKDAKKSILIQDTGNKSEVTPRLTWKLNYKIVTADKISRPFYVIDALSGKIVRNWQGIDTTGLGIPYSKKNREFSGVSQNRREVNKTSAEVSGAGGNEKSGLYQYGGDRPKLEVTSDGSRCFLANDHVEVYNSHSTEEEQTEVHHFPCQEGNHDEINEAYSPLNDAFYHCNVVYDMYKSWFGVPPVYDGVVKAQVHFGQQYENAFWDGEYIVLGDGHNNYYPYTSLDMISHEIAHGFTEQHSFLTYSGQSGAINEAFSDMAGEAAEFFLFRENDWKFAGDMSRTRDGMRYMDDPEQDGLSISHMKDYCPGINVHFASGIFNRVFYLLAHMPGWDTAKAFEVFVTANRLYWTQDSSFSYAAYAVVQAASEAGLDMDLVIDSFLQVGIDPFEEPSSGILAMHDLSKAAVDDIVFQWNPPTGTADVQIDAYISEYAMVDSGFKFTMFVESDHYSLFDRPHKGSTHAQIKIEHPSETPHKLILTGSPFMHMSLMVTSNAVTVSCSVSSDPSGEDTQVPVEITAAMLLGPDDRMFSIRCDVTGVTMAVRYDSKVDMDNLVFDYFQDSTSPIPQVNLCNPREGLYYLALRSSHGFTGAKVTLHKHHILQRL